MKTPTTAGLVITSPQGVLIIKDRRGRWTLPGGQIDRGESILQGATREVFEETGLKRALKILKRRYHQSKRYGKGKIARYFKAKIRKLKKKVKLSKEHVAYKWISAKKAIKKLIKRHQLAIKELL